ncbi:hypothetical protein PC123_g6010 [Phytophthora cactorum]|nr:hypothetical protein PC123_g6010 [Phytophthora cactorum]
MSPALERCAQRLATPRCWPSGDMERAWSLNATLQMGPVSFQRVAGHLTASNGAPIHEVDAL